MTGSADNGKVHRLQPLRVLISGRDRRFARVTTFLLSQRGYDVAQCSPKQTLESVRRNRSDIVLLETNGSRIIAARKAAALQALPSAPSVLLVFDDGEEELWPGVSSVKKWTTIDALVDEIEAVAHNRPSPHAKGETAYL